MALYARAQRSLEVIQRLQVHAIFTSTAPASEQPAITAAFGKAGLTTLLHDGELRLGLTSAAMAQVRVDASASQCVLAVVGREAADFPNGLLPVTTPEALHGAWGAGWFLVDQTKK